MAGLKIILVIVSALSFANLSPVDPVAHTNSHAYADPPRVIVIGAGVAGIAAASKLHATGRYNVTVLEAMGRIGGRTHTLKFGDLGANHIELGGEWIHGEKGNSIFELTSPLGLLLNTSTIKEFGDQFGFQSGEILNSSLANSITELLSYMWHDPEGWDEEFEEDYPMGIYARMIMERYNIEHPIHINSSFMEMVYDWAHRITNAEDASFDWFEKSNTDEGDQYVELEGFPNIPWKPPYSFLSLLQLMLTGTVTEDGYLQLPKWIELNKEVTRIVYTPQNNAIFVCLKDGSCQVTDHVIFTPSLGVLKANHLTLFHPPLSVKKQLAIANIGFGAAVKYFLEFAEPWWPPNYEGTFLLWNDHDYNYNNLDWTYWRPNITSAELMQDFNGFPLWARSILNIFTVDSGSAPNMVRIWMTGHPSRFLETLDPVYIKTTVMKVIHQFLDPQFPNITEPINTYQSIWTTNPFTRGVYSYRTLASEGLDVWAADIATPIVNPVTSKPILCFAGEATHPTLFSTVHGAYDTGVREFNRIESWYAGAKI